jgi:hypothetical protein
LAIFEVVADVSQQPNGVEMKVSNPKNGLQLSFKGSTRSSEGIKPIDVHEQVIFEWYQLLDWGF